MRTLHTSQRILLALFALWAGSGAILGLILSRPVLRELFGVQPGPGQLLFWQLYGGARLGLALTALVAAFVPRPPRALVWAVALALSAEVAGPLFSFAVSMLNRPDLKPYLKWLAADAMFALALIGTQLARRLSRT